MDGPPLRVVIADASRAVQDRLVRMITTLGSVLVVGCAGDGAQALDLVRERKPDVLILHLQLPGRNTLDVLSRVRADAASPLVVMLADDPTPAVREHCQALGASAVLDRTLEFEELMPLLRSLAVAPRSGDL